MKVAPLDDYQNVAPGRADWSGATKRAVTSALTDNVAEPNAAIEGLRPFDVIPILRGCVQLPRGVQTDPNRACL
jgi:hypothetical protein